jgi:DHA1 family tetracycline resistance protein-like MFS transporter
MNLTDDSATPPLPATRTPCSESPTSARRAWVLLIVITLLNSIGMTIVLPVLPFITLQYVPEGSLALWVGVLESVGALCAFLVAPQLGGLSD